MKSFRLSSARERIGGILFCIAAVACFIALLYTLRHDLTVLILAALGVLILSVTLGTYVYTVSRAVCIADPENKKLHVKALRDYTLDLSNAATLETIGIKNSHVTGRALIFSDDEGRIIGSVPTMFTSRQGVMAEPMAMELAQTLGLSFKANLNPWDYDEEARIAHEKEVAIEQKAAAKARREAKIKLRMQKLQNKQK